MTWQNNSEIVAGLVLQGKFPSNAVDPRTFIPPYNEAVKLFRDGKSIEDIIGLVNSQPIQSAFYAADSLNGLGEDADWGQILRKSYVDYKTAKKLRRFADDLKNGKEVDWSKVSSLARDAQQLEADELVPLSNVESGEVPFIASGWPAIDEHIGGWPEVGLIIWGGAESSGKTTGVAKVLSKFVQQYPEKRAAMFSIEMILREIAKRIRETNELSKEEEERIILSDKPVTPEQVINRAATIDNLGFVGIDFADLMLIGETTESSMAHIYRTLMKGSKELECPVMILSQLSYKYTGGIPRPTDIRYTSMAKALAWMLIMSYNPARDSYANQDEDILPIMPNRAYLCFHKIRGGFRKHEDDSPGAIQLAFQGSHGWSDGADGKNRWYSLKNLS